MDKNYTTVAILLSDNDLITEIAQCEKIAKSAVVHRAVSVYYERWMES